MIIEQLSKIEITSKYRINAEHQKIDAVKGFKELLKQIDFSSEIIPFQESEKLHHLFTSLKGQPLNQYEITLVQEMAKGMIWRFTHSFISSAESSISRINPIFH